ncbi:hypothetical protein H920_12981 [Fukomys damarensis]|uniref:Uncharacterized protein n=1 Tax=Fukomys damarensis TaxID=885580 RepID=A0A091D3P6_FUKDA|nr:hypothetical protein H920_12981 [Fukomys damarensis]
MLARLLGGSAPGRPNASGQKIYASEIKDLYNQPDGSILKLESDAHGKDQSYLMKAAAIPRDSELPSSSSSNENSLVCIRKTICNKLLLENQQAKIFHSSSLFMAIGNNLQVDPPCPDNTDSVQMGITS